MVAIDDLVDTLVTEHHGPAASEMLAMMTGAAVPIGLLAAVEAGMATVQMPADVGVGPDIAPLVDGSGDVLGDPAWACAVRMGSGGHTSASPCTVSTACTVATACARCPLDACGRRPGPVWCPRRVAHSLGDDFPPRPP